MVTTSTYSMASVSIYSMMTEKRDLHQEYRSSSNTCRAIKTLAFTLPK
jgi:hypothetical protein